MERIQTIGIVGGNLLASMLGIEAKKRGIKTLLLEPEIDNIAAHIVDQHLISPINRTTIERLALRVDVVIFAIAEIPILPKKVLDTYRFVPSQGGVDLVASRVEQLICAGLAEVPTPTYYHHTNKFEFLNLLQACEAPYRVYQVYQDGYEMMEIESEASREVFLSEIDDLAVEWIAEMKNTYQRILSLSVIKKAGKVYTYPIQEEHLQADDDIKYMVMPPNITKPMSQKVIRYAKKMLAEVDTEGLFSFKFGIKEKQLEFIGVNPGVTVGDIATLHCTDLSIYEQVINLLDGEKIKNGVLTSGCELTAVVEGDESYQPKFPYHKYQFDRQSKQPVNLYIKKIDLED